jgi:hypothetical protein
MVQTMSASAARSYVNWDGMCPSTLMPARPAPARRSVHAVVVHRFRGGPAGPPVSLSPARAHSGGGVIDAARARLRAGRWRPGCYPTVPGGAGRRRPATGWASRSQREPAPSAAATSLAL